MSKTPNVLPPKDETPPIFDSWKPLYGVVLALHAFIIFLFYIFTNAYS